MEIVGHKVDYGFAFACVPQTSKKNLCEFRLTDKHNNLSSINEYYKRLNFQSRAN